MKSIYYCVLINILIAGCKKNEVIPINDQSNEVMVGIYYNIDGKQLILDTILYKNEAKNIYSVTRLNYFLSNIRLIRSDGSTHLLKDVQYMDASMTEFNQFIVKNIPEGTYIGLVFNFGLDSTKNISNNLPTTAYNLNMTWPESMGGGYHFMKLEGDFKDSNSTYGYALHIGTNICVSELRVYKNILISKTGLSTIYLSMNINELFRNPETYDFNKDGNAIMGNKYAMQKIVRNAVDIFN